MLRKQSALQYTILVGIQYSGSTDQLSNFPPINQFPLLLRQPGRIWPCRGPEGQVQGAAAGQPGQETWAKFTLYIKGDS